MFSLHPFIIDGLGLPLTTLTTSMHCSFVVGALAELAMEIQISLGRSPTR